MLNHKTRGLIAVVPIAALVLGLAGCEDKAGVKQETTYSSPDGKTKVTKETKVETSGNGAPVTDATTTPKNP